MIFLLEEGSFEKKKDPLDSLPKGTFDLEVFYPIKILIMPF